MKELAKAGLGLVEGAVGAGLGMMLGKSQDRRQIKQQEKLMGLQLKGNKEMADYNQSLQMDMWNKTNYGAQMEHIKNAGLNPGLIYGMGGAGGATTGGGSGSGVSGGTADGASAGVNNQMAMGMMLAQKEVLESQARKNNAEAEATAGVKTAEGQARTASIEFQNAVNKAIGVENLAGKERTAIEQIQLKWSKELAEYNTWSTVNYAGKPTDDPNSPIAKAMKAGIEKTFEELKLAKTTNEIAKATATIEGFKANLAEQGISPETPWYYKIIGDLLTKAGINPTDIIGNQAKDYLKK